MLDEWNHIVWDNPEFGPPLPDNSKELIHVAFFDTRPSPSLREMGQAAAIFKHSHVVVHALLAHKPSAEAVPPGIRVTMMKMTKRLACIYDNFAHNSHGPGPALDSLAMAQSHATISNFNSFSQAYLIKTLLPWILPPEVPRIILLDTDTVVVRPIVQLWSVFESFGDAVIGLAKEQSKLYTNKIGRNGGVQLMKLDAARASATYVRYLDRVAAGRAGYYIGFLGDQTLYTFMGREAPHLVHDIGCEWNRQIAFHFGLDNATVHECPRSCGILHANMQPLKCVARMMQDNPSCSNWRKIIRNMSAGICPPRQRVRNMPKLQKNLLRFFPDCCVDTDG